MGKETAGNIILVGFSYTGKTKVGQEVAGMLGWRYVDTDEEIVRLAGKPIDRIFAEDGEPRFREMEREALRKVCQDSNVVISTGGGVVVDTGNRELMLKNGVVICLEAKPATIYRRLLNDAEENPGQEVRPLLAGDDPPGRIEWLKGVRQPYYALSDWTVHTDALTIEEAAKEVIHGWRLGLKGRMEEPAHVSMGDLRESDAPYCEHDGAACVITTATEKYPVFAGWGYLEQLGNRMRNAGIKGRVHIVSDDQVFPLYGAKIEEILVKAGYAVDSLVVPRGERSKSFETAVSLYDRLVNNHTERGDSIVALGGGMVGDLAGFIAATFLRGLPFIQVPTSLIGMVDAAIGGKVAIDHPEGKNLIGSFYQPRLVLADVQTLTTLPRRELVSGWAEVVKHAMIRDPHLLTLLEDHVHELSELKEGVTVDVVARSAAIKAGIVSEDEKEVGVRIILNYGHTVAHGLEAATDYQKLLHGEAVSIGMTAAAMISHRIGILSRESLERQNKLLDDFGLPAGIPAGIDIDRAMHAMNLDKKVTAKKIRWVLLEDIGQPVIRDDVPDEVITGVISDLSQI